MTMIVSPAHPVLVSGYRASCDVWACDDQAGNGLVLVSFLGVYTVIQALWGTLVAGRALELQDHTTLRRIPKGENKSHPTRYRHTITRFPQIEQAHLVMVAQSATLQVQSGERGYLIAANEPASDRFFAVWNRCLTLPARSVWAPFLLKEGLRHGCVRPIAGYGCHAWAIEPAVETWASTIQGGIEDGVLQ